jgi:hypothetical protein
MTVSSIKTIKTELLDLPHRNITANFSFSKRKLDDKMQITAPKESKDPKV